MKYWIGLVLISALQAQEAGLTARELFYRDDDARPAARTRPARKTVRSEKKAVVARAPATPTAPDGTPILPASAANLGVRYNVLQVTDRAAGTRKPVDPDTRFHAGDCVAVELASNRDGFVYVFNQGSTGAWQALLPSREMPDQSNTIKRGSAVVVPSAHCFEFDRNPGREKLLVVVTEREEDQKSLGEAIRGSGGRGEAPPRQVLAENRLTREIEMLRSGQMIGRDIKIAKIGMAKAGSEPAHAVYAVRASAGPDERLVIEIDLRHE